MDVEQLKELICGKELLGSLGSNVVVLRYLVKSLSESALQDLAANWENASNFSSPLDFLGSLPGDSGEEACQAFNQALDSLEELAEKATDMADFFLADRKMSDQEFLEELRGRLSLIEAISESLGIDLKDYQKEPH